MRLLRRRYGSTVLQMILNFAGIAVFAVSGQRHGVLRDRRRGVGGRQRSELVRRRPAGTLSAIAGSTVRDVLAARTDQVIDVSLVSQRRVVNAWAAKSAAWSAIPLVL